MQVSPHIQKCDNKVHVARLVTVDFRGIIRLFLKITNSAV